MRHRTVFVGLAMAALVGLTACGKSTTGGAGSGATSSTVTVTPQGSVPWLAYQDGTGAWKLLSGTTFTVSDAAGRYGLAWVCTYASASPVVSVVLATTAESAAATVDCPPGPSGSPISVAGNLKGMASTDTGFVAIDGQFQTKIAANGSYSVPSRTGSHTLVAYGRDGSGAPTRMLVEPVSFTGSLTGYTLDLSSSNSATAPFSDQTATLKNAAPGAGLNMYADLLSALTGRARLAAGSASSLTFPVVPASLQGSDIFFLSGLAGVSTGSSGFSTQEVDRTVASIPGPVGLALPGALSSGSIGVANGVATASWGSVAFNQSGGVTVYVANVDPTGVTSDAAWHVAATKGWLGTKTAYTFPDLSATSNWNAAWKFPTGITATAATSVLRVNLSLPAVQLYLRTLSFRSFPSGVTLERATLGALGTY